MTEYATNMSFVETHIFGANLAMRCVGASDPAERPWLEGRPICGELKAFQMLHLGRMEASYPFEVIRPHQGGAYFLVTLRGRGSVLMDGGWRVCKEGQACLLPAYTANAFRCIEGEEWMFCWIRYRHPEEQIPLISSTKPIMGDFQTEAFRATIEGVLAEAEGEHRQRILEKWIQIIHLYVLEFTAPYEADDRLWKLWMAIKSKLSEEWTLRSMEQVMGLSGEQIRRLCKAKYGRSPMQHVRWLRMQRAAELLLTTRHKIESIAYDVGYKNATSFSLAFSKQYNLTPSLYRVSESLRKPAV